MKERINTVKSYRDFARLRDDILTYISKLEQRLAEQDKQIVELESSLGSCDQCTVDIFAKCDHKSTCLLRERVLSTLWNHFMGDIDLSPEDTNRILEAIDAIRKLKTQEGE